MSGKPRAASRIIGSSALLLALAGCSRQATGPRPLSMSPDRGRASATTPVTISGESFVIAVRGNLDDQKRAAVDATFRARLGSRDLEDVLYVNQRLLTALVPAGLPTGSHDLVITDPRGQTAVLPGAFTVMAALADGGHDGPPDRLASERPVDAASADRSLDRPRVDGRVPDLASLDRAGPDAARPDVARPDVARSDATGPDGPKGDLPLLCDPGLCSCAGCSCAGTGPGSYCSVPCDQPGGCACPPGVPCRVVCQAGCQGAIDCSLATSCEVDCAQAGCTGLIKCGSGPCTVSCRDTSCKGGVSCGAGPCRVRCEDAACKGPIDCGAGPCVVECAGSECGIVDCGGACSCLVTTTGSGGPPLGPKDCEPACLLPLGRGCSITAAPVCDTCP